MRMSARRRRLSRMRAAPMVQALRRARRDAVSLLSVSISAGRRSLSRLLGRSNSRTFSPPDGPADTLLPGPIRGELLGAEQLSERIAALARGQRLTSKHRRRARLLARL